MTRRKDRQRQPDVADTTFDVSLERLREWIAHVFERPAEGPESEWWWDLEAEFWDGSPAEITGLIAITFERSAELLAPFSDAQLNRALWGLVSGACTDYHRSLSHDETPYPLALRALRATEDIFRNLFAVRCTRATSAGIQTPSGSPLNSIVYMWWDITALEITPAKRGLGHEILTVMERTLRIDHEACQEGSLHGLGHFRGIDPTRVETIIDSYLRTTNPPPSLRDYAAAARTGCVL